MVLRRGTAYKLSSKTKSSVTILACATPTATPASTPTQTAIPTPTPTPTVTPTPSPTNLPEVWLAVRTDGLPGSGTQADPFNVATPAMFDAKMYAFRSTSNLSIHLIGAAPFRTDIHH